MSLLISSIWANINIITQIIINTEGGRSPTGVLIIILVIILILANIGDLATRDVL